MTPLSAVAVGALAVIHLFAGKLRFLDVIPRSRWLSFASGVSVAYVFLYLLPELAGAQKDMAETAEQMGDALGFLEHHVWALAALGLAIFYGMERLAQRSHQRRGESREEGRASRGVFWLHIVSFSVYNFLIGYVLVERAERGTGALLLFFIAMAMHFFVNDYGLREHHEELYARKGRWILAVVVVVGWVVGGSVNIVEQALTVPLALVTGGVILNVMKEELPKERDSRFSAFALGLVLYGAVLLAI